MPRTPLRGRTTSVTGPPAIGILLMTDGCIVANMSQSPPGVTNASVPSSVPGSITASTASSFRLKRNVFSARSAP